MALQFDNASQKASNDVFKEIIISSIKKTGDQGSREYDLSFTICLWWRSLSIVN
jgi:hypothetical protein